MPATAPARHIRRPNNTPAPRVHCDLATTNRAAHLEGLFRGESTYCGADPTLDDLAASEVRHSHAGRDMACPACLAALGALPELHHIKAMR